jgi:hypothetical protein
MKQSAKRRHQMNLPLLTTRDRPAVPSDQQKELTLTLVELLIDAARNIHDSQGGEHDDVFETHP